MRRIIRKPSSDICPSGFIWVAWVRTQLNSTTNYQIVKIIYPAGTLLDAVFKQQYVVQITEINI